MQPEDDLRFLAESNRYPAYPASDLVGGRGTDNGDNDGAKESNAFEGIVRTAYVREEVDDDLSIEVKLGKNEGGNNSCICFKL